MSTKISQLPAASALSGSETTPVVQSGVTKGATQDQMLAIPSVAWASLPAANSVATGTRRRVSDVGPNGTDWISNGTDWVPVNGFALIARSAVAASVTGTVSETALATITVPAGMMGTNGQLRITTLWSHTNSANNKTLRIRLGGISGSQLLSIVNTTTASTHMINVVRNRNSASSQIANFSIANSFTTNSAANVTTAVNTAVAQDLVITGVLANTGETITLESYSVELIR